MKINITKYKPEQIQKLADFYQDRGTPIEIVREKDEIFLKLR